MPFEHLFEPFVLSDLTLPNRFAMSPMTRSRYGADGVPQAMHAQYYAQRAEAGLIFSEAVRISEQATGYVATPGIFNPQQVEGWRRVTEAVHAGGAKIFCQLWHVGRVSHRLLQPGQRPPVAPSAIAANTQVFGPEGLLDTSEPRELETSEIAGICADFKRAAENAKEAGFDGVEIHAGNGYLIHQFFSQDANRRTDAYGGSLENRLRFLNEVVDAVAQVWSRSRISVRIGPQIPVPGIADHADRELYEALARSMKSKRVGLLHITELLGDHPALPTGSEATERWAPALKELFGGATVINGGLTAETAEEALAGGDADLAAFGLAFLSNPDLPTRVRRGLPLTAARQETIYGGGAAGYTDYLRWEQTLASELTGFTSGMVESMPQDKLEKMQAVMQEVLSSGIGRQALKTGDQAPAFELTDAQGKPFSLQAALARGPVVLSFYRGGWCPYCNLELKALHRVLPEIRELGGSLLAISPELPDRALVNGQKQGIDFPVLSDPGNRTAEAFGLAFKLTSDLQSLYEGFGIDLPAFNGDDSHTLPVPATYVIDTDGTIRFAFAKADHAQRAEPQDVLAALKQIVGAAAEGRGGS